MAKTSKVSFVLPAYKRRFLKAAISSILNQTYRDLELIVVDDASHENLKEIVDGFEDSRLTYHRNERNLGRVNLVSAWNHAMCFAEGEWCVLAGDDDVYHPEFVEAMLELTKKYPDTDLFHSRVKVIDSEGEVLHRSETRAEWESGIEMFYNRAALRREQMLPDFMFRRSAWEKLGGFIDFPLAWYSDDATWIALAKKGGAGYSSRELFSFRASGINLSTSAGNFLQKAKAGVAFYRWAVAYLRDLEPKTEEERALLSRAKPRILISVLKIIIDAALRSLPFKLGVKILQAYAKEK